MLVFLCLRIEILFGAYAVTQEQLTRNWSFPFSLADENALKSWYRTTNSLIRDVSQSTNTASAANNSPDRAVNITQFTLQDAGGDNLPTSVREIVFEVTAKKVSLSKLVAGLTILINGVEVRCRIAQVSDVLLVAEPLNGLLNVEDGSSATIVAGMYFNPEEVTDLASISFKLKGVEVATASTLVEPFNPIQTNVVMLQVNADRLVFPRLPSVVKPSASFGVTVKATDEFGNTDLNFNEDCTLSVAGAAATTLKSAFKAGVVSFSSVLLSVGGTYQVSAAAGSLSVTKELVVADADSYLKATLFSPTLPSLIESPKFFDLLKFKVVDAGTADMLETQLRQLTLAAVDLNGTLLGKRMADSLQIYVNGTKVNADFTFYSSGKTLISLPPGAVSVPNGGELEILIRIKLVKDYFYTRFYFSIPADEVKVGTPSSLISTANSYSIRSVIFGILPTDFRIVGASLSSKGNVLLTTNQQQLNLANIEVVVTDGQGTVVGISNLSKTSNSALAFRVNADISPVKVLLKRNIGGEIDEDLVTVYTSGGLEYGDVAISEIMADPNPPVGLPDAEYIELYNKGKDMLNLEGWSLHINGKISRFEGGNILPSSYTVVTSPAGGELLKRFGNVAMLSNFEGLPNGGGDIAVTNSHGKLVASAFYTDALQQGAAVEGGVSLERIDLNSIAGGDDVWTLSKDSKGGTPCAANSVAGVIVDTEPPRIEKLRVEGVNQLEIVFNEPVMVDPGITILLNKVSDKAAIAHDIFNPRVLTIKTSMNMLSNVQNFIRINGLSDYAGNRFSDEIIVMPGGKLLKGSILINEILFNPEQGISDYVEMVNVSGSPIDLANVGIARRNAEGVVTEMVSLSKSYKILLPNQLVVACETPEAIASRYSVNDKTTFIKVAALPSFPNDAGVVVLVDLSGNVLDEMSYSERMHFKMLPTFKGVSLERLSVKANQWMSASKEVGYGTPGKPNSQQLNSGASTKRFKMASENISPDNDGYNDYLTIEYQLSQAGGMGNVTIFSSTGMVVKRLIRNELWGTEGVVTWDGVADSGMRVSRGLYIAYIQVTFPGGTSIVDRLVFAVVYR